MLSGADCKEEIEQLEQAVNSPGTCYDSTGDFYLKSNFASDTISRGE